MLRNRPREAVATNTAIPKQDLKPIGTISYLPNGKAMSTGYRKGPDTQALESNAHTSTFWLHHTGLQHSSPVGYLGTAILRGQKSKVSLDELSYASRNGLSDKERKKRYVVKDKELYRKDNDVTLMVKQDPPPLKDYGLPLVPRDEFTDAADAAKALLSKIGNEPCLTVDKLPCADG